MRTTTFKTILDAVALAWQAEGELTAEDKAVVAASMDTLRVNQLWTYADWKELEVIEQRYFAEDWSGTAAYEIGDLVYWPDTDLYYTCLTKATSNDPSNTNDWELVTGYAQLVAFEQEGKTAIGTVLDVTLSDPRLNTDKGTVAYIRREQAVQVQVNQKFVWLRFTRREPRLTSAAYDAATTYAKGDVVYQSTTGQCYVSGADNNQGNPPPHANWQEQELPHFGQAFFVRAALADLYESKDQEKKADRQEVKAFDRLGDAYHRQQGLEGQQAKATRT